MAFKLNRFRPKVDSVFGADALDFASLPSAAKGPFLSGLRGERRGEMRAEPDFFIISIFYVALLQQTLQRNNYIAKAKMILAEY